MVKDHHDNEEPTAQELAWAEKYLAALRERETWRAEQKYDGVLGEPPPFIKGSIRKLFLIHRNNLLEHRPLSSGEDGKLVVGRRIAPEIARQWVMAFISGEGFWPEAHKEASKSGLALSPFSRQCLGRLAW